MRRGLALGLGILLGQWLAVTGQPSPGTLVQAGRTVPGHPPAGAVALLRREPPGSEVDAGGPGLVAVVRLDPSRGVWLAPVVLNESRRARFLVDTGSSVTLIAPAVAEAAGIEPRQPQETLDLQTVGGLTTGVVATLSSLRVGGAVLHDVPVVIHDLGPGIDGILGNTFLARWRLTLDADRRLLRLDGSDRSRR